MSKAFKIDKKNQANFELAFWEHNSIILFHHYLHLQSHSSNSGYRKRRWLTFTWYYLYNKPIFSLKIWPLGTFRILEKVHGVNKTQGMFVSINRHRMRSPWSKWEIWGLILKNGKILTEFPSEISGFTKHLALNFKVHKNEFQQKHWDHLNFCHYWNYHVCSFI